MSMVTIGKQLAKLRKAAGLSYRRLGAQVDISFNNLAQYEHNDFGPSFENAIKIAGFFKVPIEYLVYGEKAEKRYHDIELLELFGKIDDLPDEFRGMVKNYMRQVISHSEEKERLTSMSERSSADEGDSADG